MRLTPDMAPRLLALVAALLLGAAQAAAPPELRVALAGDADSLDPQAAVSAPALVIAFDLFEGLYTLDNNGQPVLGAAAAVRTLEHAGGPALEFTLRPNLRWSDGRPLTAQDFEYSLQRLADPATAGNMLASYVGQIRQGDLILRGKAAPATLGVTALDERRLRIDLVRNVAWFPAVLAFPSFAPVPRHVIEKHGRQWTRPGNHVSNGPFRLVDWQPNRLVRTERNPYFHAVKSVRLPGVRYLPVADQNAGFRLFQSAQIDTMTNFPPEKYDYILANMRRELHIAPSLGVTAYLFNFRKPLFRDVRVRRALALAVDRGLLTKRIVRTGDLPAYGLVTPGLPGYPAALPAPLATQAARTAEARRLLAAAGFGPGRPLSFELLYHTNEEHKNVALAVAAMWQAIGVRVTLRNAERQAVEVAVRNGEFDMARAALFSAYADANGLFGNFSTGHSANVSAYSNRAFDGAIGRAEAMPSAGADRAALQRDAERQLIADQAFVPLYFMTSRRLVAQRVSGWSDQNLTALRPARYLDVVTAPAR